MTTVTDVLAEIRSISADLETLDDLRHRYLHKRALLLAHAIDGTELSRMDIAIAAGVSVTRAYAIANQGRGITSASDRLLDAIESPRLIRADEVESWAYDRGGIPPQWVAFPYRAPDSDE